MDGGDGRVQYVLPCCFVQRRLTEVSVALAGLAHRFMGHERGMESPFFRWHLVEWALLEIIGLFCLILWLFFRAWRTHGQRSAVWTLLPYLIWLIIATSLNAYSLAV